jgi:glycosyltransferase involved in cell wall biosynthesis
MRRFSNEAKQNMKILMLVQNPMTHDARVSKEAEALASSGCEVTVAAMSEGSLPENESVKNFTVKRIMKPTPKSGFGLSARIKGVWLRNLAVIREARQTRPAVVHAHELYTLFTGWLAARLSGAKLVYDSHELFVEKVIFNNGAFRVKRRIWQFIEKALAPRAELVISDSEGVAQEMKARYGIKSIMPLLNCPALHNGAGAKSGKLRASLGVGPEIKIALYQGVVSPGRGLEQLIRGAKHLAPGILVAILGGTGHEYERKLKELAVQEGADSIVFMDRVPYDELLDYTAGADIGLLPIEEICLHYELCMPNKLFEYLMAGLPVLAPDNPWMREVVAKNAVGVLCDTGKPESVAGAINSIIGNPEKYAKMASNARRAAEEKFNWELESRKLVDAYREIAK